MKKLFLVAIILLIGYNLSAQQGATKATKFVDKLMKKMNLNDKIGQLNLPASGDIVTGQAGSSQISKKIAQGSVGGLFNIKSIEKIKEIQKLAVTKTRLKIPLLFGMDVIHGYRTVFPIPLGLACTWDMDLVRQSAQIAAKEASADGINWTFSPMVDICRDPRWGRIAEGAGEDPYLGSELAKAMVQGYQGNNLADNNTIMACVKHFALYGASEAGRDYNTVDMGRNMMYNVYFPPYKAAVDAGVGSVMMSFNEVDGIPATANKWLITDVLRKQWGFDGFVVTDYTGINEMTAHGMGDLKTVSALAMNAGVDMDMVGEGFLTTLKESIKKGVVTEAQIDIACRRILLAKYQLGLFDNPYKYLDEKRAKQDIYTEENKQIARRIAASSMVLLKNQGDILPLSKSDNILVVGPLADAQNNMPGTWSVAATHSDATSLLAALKEVLPNSAKKISVALGSNLHSDSVFQKNATMFGKTIKRDNRSAEIMINEAVLKAKKVDVIVAAIGESAEMSGEASSRASIQIPQVQKDLLQALVKTGKPVVVVLFTGRPLDLSDEDKLPIAILNVWYPGSEAGYAISDVLFGDVNPSGKLTTSFPRSVGQIPIYYNHKNTGRPLGNKQGKFEKFRSNYLDVRNEPLYPFGYGLSYTDFSYADLVLDQTKLSKNGKIKAKVTVTNMGDRDGYEIVQLYIRDMVGSITRPVKELKGFQKVFFKKGESKEISFDITEEMLKFYNSELSFVAEPGAFKVFLGGDSQQTLEGNFVLER